MADVVEKAAAEEATTPTEDTKTDSPAPAKEVEAPKADAAGPEGAEPAKPADDATDADASKLERAIIRQIEYYFGDANLSRDKFLIEQTKKTEEGWVPFSVLLTFKRLAELTTDAAVIVDAMMKSDEGLVEINKERDSIRRHPERPVPEQNEERRKEIMSRTAYAKGFPLDSTISEIIQFFTDYENVLNITMRKYLEKPSKTYKFKGSVFVTFEKKEQAEQFITKDKVVFKERELMRKWQDKYLEDKRVEVQQKNENKKKAKQEDPKLQLPKGSVVFFEGPTEALNREMLREALEKMKLEWEIAYIDFSKGDKTGHIRFYAENVADKFLEKLESLKLKVNDSIELTLRKLEDEEETTYLEKVVESMKQRRQNFNKHKGGHGHHHRHHGHNHGNRKRRNDDKGAEHGKKKKLSSDD